MPTRSLIFQSGILTGDQEREWTIIEEERDTHSELQDEESQTDKTFRSTPSGTGWMPSGMTYAGSTIVDGVSMVMDASRKVDVPF
jgi:hypothetical protein